MNKYGWAINQEKLRLAIDSLKELAKKANKEFVEIEEEVKAEYRLLGGLVREMTEKEKAEANTESTEEAESKQANKAPAEAEDKE